MNIERKNIDELSFQLTVSITGDDYVEIEKKKLNERKKNAEFKGFRKGKAPVSLIKKIYGEQVLVDAVNEVVGKSLNDYIVENELKLIGEPIGSENQPEVEWKSGNDFTFVFDLAVNPEIDFEVSDADKLNYYKINVTKAAEKEMKDNLLKQLGGLHETEKSGKEDFLTIDLVQEGNELTGIEVPIAQVNEEHKDALVGLKAGDKKEINVNELFTDEAVRARILKLEGNQAEDFNPVFEATVINVKRFMAAELNQDTFDKIAGEPGKFQSEEDLDAFITERLTENYEQEADFRVAKEIRDMLVEKANLSLPEEFLKRWLLYVNQGKFTKEDIDKEFDAFLVDYRWQLVRSYIISKNEIKFENEDFVQAAKEFARYQYMMYGMGNIPEQFIDEAANQMLKDENQFRRIQDNVETKKVIESVKEQITLTNKKISLDKFRELK